MPKNPKPHPNQNNTYLMASTLMQKLMFNHQSHHLNQFIDGLALDNDSSLHHQPNQHLDQSITRKSKELTTDRPTLRLNLEYQPLLSPKDIKRKLSKLSNPSKLKTLKHLSSSIRQQGQSKTLSKLRRNMISVYDQKNQNTKSKEKILYTQTQQNQTELKQAPNEKHRGKSYQMEKSPHKVSVNFELFFPKQRLRSTINHTKTSTRHSLGIRNLDRDWFRIKKSAKSISLTQQQKSSQLEKRKISQQKTDRSPGDQIITGIKKHSALKYIEKVQKFKKYKDNQINKQPLFGLNVMQAEYHQMKVQHQSKNFKQKILKNKKPEFFGQIQQNKHLYQIDDNSQTLMNITMSQGVSLSLSAHHEDPQSKPSFLNTNYQENISPQKQTKCPSEQKLVTRNFFGPGELERKKLLKTKFQEEKYTKEKERGSFQGKLKNMLECLDILLNAYCCRIVMSQKQQKLIGNKSLLSNKKNSEIKQQTSRDMCLTLSNPLTLPLKRQKFLYYVGNGNNKNLIRSIMKKRGWWAETDSMQAANLVWTQLKSKEVLQKQTKMNQKTIEEPDSWFFKSRGEQNQTLLKSGRNKQNQNHRLQQETISQNYLKIFHKKMLPIFTKKIQQKQKQNQHLRHLVLSNIIHNHYDANYMLGNKKALFYNLLEYCSYKKISPYKIIPLTFHIESAQSCQFKNFIKTAKKFKNALWIVKPGQNSNRGNGIFVEKDLNRIKTHIEKNANNKHSFIVQKYLKNIFLYNKRKFDIRVYMVMSTIGGITKFFWYEEGYIRTSSQIYNTEDIRDLFIHLTNDAIQVKNETYSKYEKGNKISYTQFQRYLDMTYPDTKYSVQQLVQKMKNVAEIVVKSTYFKLDKAKKVNGFELFGLDFLIDRQFNPLLLEVNTNPCLQLSSPVLERLIPRMLENMFRLGIDPIFRPNESLSRHCSYFLYDNFFETNKFQLIFDNLFDSDFEWQQICLKGKHVVYEDEDEVFESNGDEVDVVD